MIAKSSWKDCKPRALHAFARLMGCVLLALATLSSDGQAQEPQGDDRLPAKAAALLQSAISEMQVLRDGKDDQRLRPRPTPICRGSNPTRVHPAAGVWRLGDTGRPPLLVSLEYWPRADTDEPRIMFEFLSFTDEKLELKADSQTTWRGDGSAAFRPLTGAASPAASKSQRLIQMRSLARRFNAEERHMDEQVVLRLVPQPIERYSDEERGIQDGAIFVFAYGTNPELVLLLEATASGWQYALMRMSWAELAVRFDDREVARFEQLSTFPTTGPYQTAARVTHALDPSPSPKP
jgi:hypothetical protein